MWSWFRKRSRIAEINQGTVVSLPMVLGVFRVTEINYNINGQAYVGLLREDLFASKNRAE